MKKNSVSIILSASIIASLLTGCGNESNKAADTATNTEVVTVSVENNDASANASNTEDTSEDEKKVETLTVTVSDWNFDSLIYFNEKYLIAKEDEKYFLIDVDGNKVGDDAFSAVIETTWDSVRYNMQDGCMIAVAGNEDTGYKSYVIDRSLSVIYEDEDAIGYLTDYRDNLIRKEYKDDKKLTFIPLGEKPIDINGIKENQMITNSSYGAMIVSGTVYYEDLNTFSYTFKTADFVKNRRITPEMINPCTVDGYPVLINDNAPGKDGFVSAALVTMDENGKMSPYATGFYNIQTGKFYKGDDSTTSCGYRFEKNGCSKCTVIDGRVFINTGKDDEDKQYGKIYDVENEAYALDDTFYSAAISYFDYLLVENMDHKYGFLKNGDLTHAGEWYDDASAFLNGYALVNIDGKEYLINESFEIVSEGFDGVSAMAPNSYFEFSDMGDKIMFFSKGLDEKYHLVNVEKGE